MSGELSRRPTPLGSALGVLAALIATMVALAYSSVGGMAGLLGLLVLLLGLLLPRPGLLGVGAIAQGTGVFLGGLAGAPASVVILGIVAAIMAWDLSHNSASHGRQLGRETPTGRAEGVHALGSLLAGLVSAAIAYGLFVVVAEGQPATAVALLALASVLFVLAMR